MWKVFVGYKLLHSCMCDSITGVFTDYTIKLFSPTFNMYLISCKLIIDSQPPVVLEVTLI